MPQEIGGAPVTVLRSYVGGRWFAPDSGAPVFDAVTGDLVAVVATYDVLTMVAKEWDA
jgi:hypothetical protein